MSLTERKQKRERATYKLVNQLSVLSRTALKKDQKTIAEMIALAEKLNGVK